MSALGCPYQRILEPLGFNIDINISIGKQSPNYLQASIMNKVVSHYFGSCNLIFVCFQLFAYLHQESKVLVERTGHECNMKWNATSFILG